MTNPWKVLYHPEVEYDLKILGRAEARRLLKAIEERIIAGEPDKIGKPLSGLLAGYRRIRIGDTRLVYKINKTDIEVYIIAIGYRKENYIYELALKRK